MMKISRPPFSLFRTAAVLPTCLVAGLMAGCSAFQPEIVACPDIAVAGGAEKVVTIGADLQHPVTIRFNGVSAECTPRRDGYAMKVDLGLMLKRAPENWNKTERVPFDVTLAFVDDKDEVVSRYVFSEEAFIADRSVKSRPTFVFRTNVPSGTRVVMGLGRAVSAAE
ncbi:hypothetical protein AB8880_09075 [Alphaproteobacteria bacterium LSUCC0684]